MARPRRHFVPHRHYLISQDGNKLFPIYIDKEDRDRALDLLYRYARRYRVRVHEYGYERNRAWWIMQPSTPEGISNLMRDMQSMYSRYLNRKYRHRPSCVNQPACGPPAQRILTSCNLTPRFRCQEIGRGRFRPTDVPLSVIRNPARARRLRLIPAILNEITRSESTLLIPRSPPI